MTTQLSNDPTTNTGLDVPTMAEIQSDFVSGVQDNIASDFAINNQNMLSQVIVVSSQQLSNQWDTIEQGISVINPNYAQGNNLVDSALWVGVNKILAQPTKVYLMLNAPDGTTYPASTTITVQSPSFTVTNTDSVTIQATSCNQVVIEVMGDPIDEGTLFSFELGDVVISYISEPDNSASDVALALYNDIISTDISFIPTLSVSGTMITINASTAAEIDYSVSFFCSISTPVTPPITGVGLQFDSVSALLPFYNSADGDISIPAGTFGTIGAPIDNAGGITGVSCFQPDEGITGNDEETDQQLRIRRQQSLATGGNRTIASIRAAINETDYVQKSIVFQNRLSTISTLTGGIELLPHSIYAVVLGGYKVDIATSIFNTMSEGIQTNGSTGVYIVDDNGNNDLISFDYAGQITVQVNITVNIAKNVYYQVSGDALTNIQTAILAYFASLQIGDTMYVNSIASLAGCQVSYGVKSVTVNYKILPDGSLQTTDLTPNANQIIVTNSTYLNISLQVS